MQANIFTQITDGGTNTTTASGWTTNASVNSGNHFVKGKGGTSFDKMIPIQLAVSNNGTPIIFGDVIPSGNTELGDIINESGNQKFKTYKQCISPRLIGDTTDRKWTFKTSNIVIEIVIRSHQGKLIFVNNNDGWSIPNNIFAPEWKDQQGTPTEIPIPDGKCDIVSLTIDEDGKLIWASSNNVNYKEKDSFMTNDEGAYEFGGNDNL